MKKIMPMSKLFLAFEHFVEVVTNGLQVRSYVIGHLVFHECVFER